MQSINGNYIAYIDSPDTQASSFVIYKPNDNNAVTWAYNQPNMHRVGNGIDGSLTILDDSGVVLVKLLTHFLGDNQLIQNDGQFVMAPQDGSVVHLSCTIMGCLVEETDETPQELAVCDQSPRQPSFAPTGMPVYSAAALANLTGTVEFDELVALLNFHDNFGLSATDHLTWPVMSESLLDPCVC
jgi:hypothetical protein